MSTCRWVLYLNLMNIEGFLYYFFPSESLETPTSLPPPPPLPLELEEPRDEEALLAPSFLPEPEELELPPDLKAFEPVLLKARILEGVILLEERPSARHTTSLVLLE